MYQDVYQYLQWLQMNIQAQEKRIATLEQTIQKLKVDLKQIREKPTVHVDTIEYKFDQLKVETLEGTLNIGLNPNDLSGIEDLAVQNQSLQAPFSPKEQMRLSMEIEEAIHEYLQTDLPQIINDTQRNLAIPPNESYLSFIKEDIIKQLPSRIDFHLKANAGKVQSANGASPIEKIVIEALKQEIQSGVNVFLNNLPEHVKGMKKE
ncbi:spore germination protein GerPC [Neobacillus vireti]|uniref:Spore germination protein GerPC n=1 Tax=Neobacillus vireti LMG 21834 TaxID=1131730 RepID=A0AB94INW1_9BACI|nr:spore germination protein GerPC [Neobacillus vireti]ETI68672.1 spore germination protein GerPC [Neobacillus vireti LMG 21834]KLT19205.1 spore gernimation protein [Neobacillus vireti]